MSDIKVKKAVIPVAGKGTRFLPATKEISKEIIPIINTPMIYYVVLEAVQSGIEEIIFITSSGKDEILNYFDRNIELEIFLKENGKHEYLDLVNKVSKMIDVVAIRQKEQLGLGHAINMARLAINKDEYFAVLLGDEILINQEKPVLKQLIDTSIKYEASSIAAMTIDKNKTNKYGIIDGKLIDQRTLKMNQMVEKPDPSLAPSNLATPGRYVLSGKIFDYLTSLKKGVGGEYQLTDAINNMLKDEPFYAYEFYGERFDTGSIEGYLDATIEFALRDPSYNEFMKKLIKEKAEKYL